MAKAVRGNQTKQQDASRELAFPGTPPLTAAAWNEFQRLIGILTSEARTPYSGELKMPLKIPFPPFGFPGPEGNHAHYEAARVRQENEYGEWLARACADKMRLLPEHFAIASQSTSEDLWFQVALRLALEHVPGFRVHYAGNEKKRGRPLFWNSARLFELRTTIEHVKQAYRISDRAACSLIAINPEYAAKWGRPSKRRAKAKATGKTADKRDERQWVETLESRLHDARKLGPDMAEILESIRKIISEDDARRPALEKEKVLESIRKIIREDKLNSGK